MNIQKMMKQAAKMQEQLNDALVQKTVEVSVGGEKVTVVANGLGDIISIKIAKEVVDPEDIELLEDLDLERRKTSHRERQRFSPGRDGTVDFRARFAPGMV
jgi:DNA-binding protein YbaB